MAASFKLPPLTKKRKRAFEFPELSWSSVKIKEELKSGKFGSVYLVDFTFGEVQRHVCIKKLKRLFRRFKAALQEPHLLVVLLLLVFSLHN